MKTFLKKHLDDVLIPCGCGAVVYATFLWSTIAGFYALGIVLIALGVLVGLGGRKQ